MFNLFCGEVQIRISLKRENLIKIMSFLMNPQLNILLICETCRAIYLDMHNEVQ